MVSVRIKMPSHNSVKLEECYISIIMPTYNVESYIRQCLESVVSQTFIDFELIIIDDGSSDKTVDIIKEYEDRYPYIHLYTQEHGRQAKARNLGISQAHGRYVTFLDGDDCWPEDHLEELVKALGSNESDVCIAYTVNTFTCKKSAEFRFIDIEGEKSFAGIDDLEGVFFSNKGFPGGVCNISVRREFLADNNIMFDESLPTAEDSNFTLTVLSHNPRTVLTDKVKYYYRQDNITSTNHHFDIAKIKCYKHVMSKWFDIYKAQGREKAMKAVAVSYRQLIGTWMAVPFFSKENITVLKLVFERKDIVNCGDEKFNPYRLMYRKLKDCIR